MKSREDSLPALPKAILARMRQVERREWWLWMLVVIVTLLLTGGIAALAFSVTGNDDSYIRQSARGLLGLILLFDLYSLYQQFQIYTVRRQLLARDELFRVIAENIPDMIAVVDRRGHRLYNSPAYSKILGYSAAELQQSAALEQVHPDDRARVEHAAAQAFESGSGEMLEYRMRHKDGTWHVLESSAGIVPDAAGSTCHLIIVNRDITDRKRMEQQLQHNALHDRVTGLPNRALFLDRLERALSRAGRRSDCLCAVLVVDVDDFKKCNDSLGHSAGDELLVLIAQRLTQSIRKYDLLSRGEREEIHSAVDSATVARLGGDEFTILLEDIHDASDAVRAGKRIQQNLSADPFLVGCREVFITGTIGIAISSSPSHRPEDLLRDADIAMYRAKAGGVAGCELFDSVMHEVTVQRLELETALRKGLERSEFHMRYQPIVRLRDRKIVGFEALVRWERPQVGLLSPSAFIGVAEDTGIIIPMNRSLRVDACRQIREWQKQCTDDPPLSLSLNVSGCELNFPDLLSDIREALRETDLAATSLHLEVLENVVLQGKQPLKMIEQAKAIGLNISLDDFGSGYSCLSRLRSLPVDTIKIDRSFITRMDVNKDQQAIVRTIVALAHDFGLHVLAEGTENLEEINLLVAMGCELAQGYYFSRPVTSDEAFRLLESNRLAVR